MAVLIDKDRQRTREIVKELLRQIEARPDITKEELLARVGKSEGYLRKSVFKGRIPLDVFLKILRELDMDPADFLAGSDAVYRPWLIGGEGSLISRRINLDARYFLPHLPRPLRSLHLDVKGPISPAEAKEADRIRQLYLSDPATAIVEVTEKSHRCFSAGFACELLSIYAAANRILGNRISHSRAAISYGLKICQSHDMPHRSVRFLLQFSQLLFDEGDFTGALQVTADAIVAPTSLIARISMHSLCWHARVSSTK